MKNTIDFIKSMVIGGIVFIIPLIILIIIIEKTFSLSKIIVTPIVKFLAAKEIMGFAADIVLAVGIILFFLFIVGIISRTSAAKNTMSRLEDKLLSRLPMYPQIKQASGSILKLEGNNSLKTVLVEAEGGKRLAFMVNKLDNNQSIIFLPDAPNPWSGSIVFIDNQKYKEINLTFNNAMQILTSMGTSSNDILKYL
jgi:uncharacterized membrane protein